jgi:hypothetical protein
VASQIAHHRTSDFRSLFLPQAEIERLESQQLCKVEYYRNKKEIPIGSSMPLNKVILLYTKNGYDGQIKVISHDAILQTSLENYDPSEQERITVRPGDLVYVQGRD